MVSDISPQKGNVLLPQIITTFYKMILINDKNNKRERICLCSLLIVV